MHAFTACKRLRVIEKYVFTVYAGIHERLDIFAVVNQATYETRASRSTCTLRKHYCEMTDNTNAHVASCTCS